MAEEYNNSPEMNTNPASDPFVRPMQPTAPGQMSTGGYNARLSRGTPPIGPRAAAPPAEEAPEEPHRRDRRSLWAVRPADRRLADGRVRLPGRRQRPDCHRAARPWSVSPPTTPRPMPTTPRSTPTSTTPWIRPTPTSRPLSVTEIAKKVTPSVVAISCVAQVRQRQRHPGLRLLPLERRGAGDLQRLGLHLQRGRLYPDQQPRHRRGQEHQRSTWTAATPRRDP